MNKKPLWSVVLIARNEEKTLPRLVGSLKEFQDRGGEILLLDTGSTDKTADVARSLGCIVHEVGEKFLITLDKDTAYKINEHFLVGGDATIVHEGDKNFDYASARNYIADFASTDMIATPDCDEIYTKLDIDRINAEIEKGMEQFEYQFVFAHDDEGKPVTQFMHSKFYNRKKLKWEGIIHEVLSGEATRVYLEESIIKLEHYQNVETSRSHYLTGLAIDCFSHPDNDRNSHYFARELMYNNRFQSAIKEFERHIAMNKWPTERSQSMMFVGDCYTYLGKPDEAFKWYMKSFDLEPNRRECLMKLAEYYWRKDSPQQAICFALAALEIKGISYYANFEPYYTYLPHEILYWGYWRLGEKEKSREHWERALMFSPNNPKYNADRQFYTGLQFTGERVVPTKMLHRPDIVREHMARYSWASQFTEGKTVLDAACGTGYASEMLKARLYWGVDNSQDALEYALKEYPSESSSFWVEDLEKPSEIYKISPEVVVSFETLEHLENPEPFLEYVKTNSELFLFSIPINMPSEFHKTVYSVAEIKTLIEKHFPVYKLFGQVDNQIGELTEDSQYIVGFAFSQPPLVSFIIPQLGREDGLKRCLDSIDNLHYPKKCIEKIIVEGEMTVPEKVDMGMAQAKGRYLVYAANDMEFDPDCLYNALVDSVEFQAGLVSFNEGPLLPDEGNICTHFLIKKSLAEDIGGIFDTEFHHVGVDNLLWAKCKKKRQAYYSLRSKITHHHFTDSRIPMDDIYRKGWSKTEEDRILLKKKLSEL